MPPEMTEHRIQFTAAMLDRIIAEEKHETRRLAKPSELPPGAPTRYGPKAGGSILWIAETHAFTGDSANPIIYRRDHENEWPQYPAWLPITSPEQQQAREKFCQRGVRWRPPRFMHRHAARLFLETESVAVEALQKLTPAGARAEGAPDLSQYAAGAETEPHLLWFRQQWDTIYADRPEAQWEANPKVLVVRFHLTADPTATA